MSDKIKENVSITPDDIEISNKWVGAGACVLFVVFVPLAVALWCANVGVMARAWHWMLGGF